MSLETKHTEKFCLYQLMLVSNGNQSVEQAISAIRAIMEPDDVKLVEKEFLDMVNKSKESK